MNLRTSTRPRGYSKLLLAIGVLMVTSSLSGHAFPQDPHTPYVRIAELEVDPAQLESFKAATEVTDEQYRTTPSAD